MKTRNTSSIMHLRRIWHSFISRYLYLLYLVTGRRLELKFISEANSILLANSYFTIYLEVQGCYQVKINDNIVLPGNISLIRLDPAQVSGPLTLLFLGCGQTLIKTYSLSPIYLQAKQLSTTLLKEPTLQVGEPHCDSKITLPEKLQDMQLASIDLPDIKIGSESKKLKVRTSLIRVELEPCQIPEYNP